MVPQLHQLQQQVPALQLGHLHYLAWLLVEAALQRAGLQCWAQHWLLSRDVMPQKVPAAGTAWPMLPPTLPPAPDQDAERDVSHEPGSTAAHRHIAYRWAWAGQHCWSGAAAWSG